MKNIYLVLFVCVNLSLLISCSQEKRKEPPVKEVEKIVPTYALYDKDGKIISRYNYDPDKQALVNDPNRIGIRHYEYNDEGKILKITSLSKDSIYSKYAYRVFEYDTLWRLIQEKNLDIEGELMEPVENYIYGENGVVLEKVIPDWDKHYGLYGQSGKSIIKYEYNNQKKIIKETYFNSKREPAIDGEMGIRYITYSYNEQNQLKEEIYHYTGTVEATDPPKIKWLNEYIYDNNGVLIESRYKFDMNEEKYDNITYFKYDFENKLYGRGKNIDDIQINIPYSNVYEIPYQQIYSSDYHTNFKYPKFGYD